MKKVYGAYIIVFLILGAVFLYEYNKPQPVDWTPDMHTKGKNPFGQKILIQRLDDIFDTVEIASLDMYHTAMQFEAGESENYMLEGTERTAAARTTKKYKMTLMDSIMSKHLIAKIIKADSSGEDEYQSPQSETDQAYSEDEQNTEISESEELEEQERLTVREESQNSSYIFTNGYFSMDQMDFFSLFTYVGEGGTALIATERFSRELALNFQLQPDAGYLPDANRLNLDSLKAQKHELRVNRYYRDLFAKEKYYVSKEITTSYFVLDSDCPADTVLVNQKGYPILIAYACGRGKIYLCSTPLLFTNHQLLHGNAELLTSLLALLPKGKVYWDDYYKRHHKKFNTSYGSYEKGDGYKRSTNHDPGDRHLDNSKETSGMREGPGTGESSSDSNYEEPSEDETDEDQSTLSFITSNISLAWAWYTLLFTLALYMISSARRRQKLIPVIEKLQNTTVEFVQMIARLYYLKNDHRDIALKKINYFQEYLRSKYYHKDLSINDSNVEVLARRSNKKPEQIKRLFELIDEVQSKGSISTIKLHVLSQRINEFKSSK